MERHKSISLLLFLVAGAAVIAFPLIVAMSAWASNHLPPNPAGQASPGGGPTAGSGGGPTTGAGGGPGGGPCGGPTGGPGGGPTSVSDYLGNLYLWFLGFVGIAALWAFVYGGVLYMFSGANPTLVGKAKTQIVNGIFGLLLAAGSYLLLYTINPDLIEHGFNLENIVCGIQQRTLPSPSPAGPAGGGGEG